MGSSANSRIGVLPRPWSAAMDTTDRDKKEIIVKSPIKNRIFSSLRVRLLFLVLIILSPVMGLIAYQDYTNRYEKRIEVLNSSLRLARNASLVYSQVIAEGRLTLRHLSTMPQFLQQESDACFETFSLLLKQNDNFMGFVAAKSNGEIFASIPPSSKPLTNADLPWFRRLLESGDFVISRYFIDRLTGKPTLLLSYPVFDAAGKLVTILSAALDIEHLQNTLNNIELPPESKLTILDSNGTIIFRFPNEEGLIGRTMPEIPIVKAILAQKEGVHEEIGFVGEPRLFGFTTIGSGTEAIHICITTPKQIAFADIRRETVQNFAAMGLIGVFSLLTAWLFSGVLIISPAKRLVEKTKQLAAGDLTIRTRQSYVSGELGLLAYNFDQMAEALQRRDEESKLAWQALQKSKEKYRLIADNATDVIWVANVENLIINYISPSIQQMVGFTDKELMDQSVAKLMTPASLEFVRSVARARIERLLQGGNEFYTDQIEVIHKDGHCILTEVNLRLMVNPVTGIIEATGVMRDMTERKKAEEKIKKLNAELEQRVNDRTAQLTAANRELEAFAYSISHDLRAPLRSVDGFARILVEDFGARLDAEGKRICAVISEGARNMGTLIDNLLAFSRIGRVEMRRLSIDMAAMANTIFLESTVPEERRRIDFRVGPLPDAHGEPVLIRQVWINLIANAVKFSSKKERAVIEVSAESRGDEAVYAIRDNGAGFDMQYAAKLFGVFQRLHKQKEFEGTGAGLAIVQRIVNRHGGRIWAESEPDKGATFYFTIA